MNTQTPGNAERFGRWFGGLWRGYVRRERRVAGWLVTRGVPADGTAALLWVIKLVVLGVLLYVAFWLVLLFVFMLLVARGFANNDEIDIYAEAKDEWRHGEAGYGLYSSGGQCIDPHDPNSPHDLNDPHNS